MRRRNFGIASLADIKTNLGSSAQPLSSSAQKVLRNSFLLLGVTLLPTIVGAVAGVQYPIFAKIGFIGYLLLFLGVIFGLQMLIIRNRHSMMGVNYLLLFTLCMGYFLGPTLSATLRFSNGVELIAMAFGGTAAIFFVLAGYASTTSRNLAQPSFFKVLFIGMWVLFAMAILSYFLQIPALALGISAGIMIVFSGFIVYTINSVVRGGEDNYILVTLTVYISLINIFQSLLFILRFFGGRN